MPEPAYDALAGCAWLTGTWRFENHVPPTRLSPAYVDVGTLRFDASAADGWVSSIAPDGAVTRCLTFDPMSRQWIYLLARGSFGMLRSADGWRDGRIEFRGLMTMIGLERSGG
ncbi:MAG: hypothetical protein R2752_10310 [Vicinamibacterales bacterium]